jgi:hypothetical protein
MKTITLTLTIDEANLVLDALGRKPFVKVYELVAKIQSQAKAQVGNGTQRPPSAANGATASGDEADHVA